MSEILYGYYRNVNESRPANVYTYKPARQLLSAPHFSETILDVMVVLDVLPAIRKFRGTGSKWQLEDFSQSSDAKPVTLLAGPEQSAL